MKRSSQFSLLPVALRSLVGLGAACVVVLMMNANVLAATPVDIYQDMESGSAGDLLTPTILNASSHPSGSYWYASDTMWVSTLNHRNLPGPVSVGGTVYNGTGGTRTWTFDDNMQLHFVKAQLPGSYSKLTVACYYTTGMTIPYVQWDNVEMEDATKSWSVLQTETEDSGGPYLRMHSQNSAQQTTYSSNHIKVTVGKPYWVSVQYNQIDGYAYGAVFDPDNGFAQVGSTMASLSTTGGLYHGGVAFGNCSAHGNNLTNCSSQGYYSNVLIDYTNAVFPLLPSAGTDTTPPSAPGTVRDGTGSDIVYTTSTTQLAANWDAASDAQSGISGYQYAIGTSAGGTQTVTWTSLGNVTTVTKTGLSLTNGQTYFFSVRAVNGVGLTGSATNSNGQKVDSTAPSAPATVRDGTGTDISTTASTTQLSANWDASTDAQSGISGYQYAIGTSAGGTQTVNWTSLGNVTTVTKAGLSLTVGQTYYFGVKAINGVGLTGSATNSNGQTVVSGGGSVTYFQDNFESWTTHGGAWSSVTGETSTHTLNTSTTYAKAGAKCLKITDTDTVGTTGAHLVKNFSPVISGDIYVRFFAFLPTGYGAANSDIRILRVWCGSNEGQMSLMAGEPVMEEVGAWTGAGWGSALSENQWHCIEMHMATPSASTLMEFWIDGVKNSATLNGSFSGSTTYDHIEFGDVVANASGTGTLYLDELMVSNSYVGTGITSSVTYFSDTFDSWSVHGGAWSSVNGESAGHTLNTSTDQARAGTKSLKLTDTDTTGSNGAYLTKNFSPVISGDIYVRFYVFLPTGYGSTNVAGNSRRVLRIYCQGNRGQMSIRNEAPFMEEIGAWGAATGLTMSENAWHCIEMHIAPPSASTLLEFWLDGVANSTHLTANFSASSTFDHIDFGDVAMAATDASTATFYLDELVVSNSYIGTLP